MQCFRQFLNAKAGACTENLRLFNFVGQECLKPSLSNTMQQQAEIFMRTELKAIKKIRQKTLLLHIILQKRFQKFQSFLATNTIFF